MSRYNRFEELKRIVSNDSLPFDERVKSMRSIGDRDIEYLMNRVMILENTLKLLRDNLTLGMNFKSFMYLIEDALKDKN